jgi:hypothetical protein
LHRRHLEEIQLIGSRPTGPLEAPTWRKSAPPTELFDGVALTSAVSMPCWWPTAADPAHRLQALEEIQLIGSRPTGPLEAPTWRKSAPPTELFDGVALTSAVSMPYRWPTAADPARRLQFEECRLVPQR